MRDFFKSVSIHDPMDGREAFYGGRTNCRKMYHKCKPGERIDYADVCSLYPWVCKYGEFALGHPTVITENFLAISSTERPYKGIVKCCVLPPQHLLHPVLPYRSGGL